MDEPGRRLVRSCTDLKEKLLRADGPLNLDIKKSTNNLQGGNDIGCIFGGANFVNNDYRGTDLRSSRRDPYQILIKSLPLGCTPGYLESIEREKTPGTCKWIEEEDQFRKWVSGDGRILWLLGGSGTGKTVLSTHIIDYLRKRTEAEKDKMPDNGSPSGEEPSPPRRPDTLAYCFCDAGDPSRSTVGGIFGAILRQLLLGHSELLNPPNSLSAEQLGSISHSPGELTLFSRAVIKELGDHFGNIFLVIDGLDGCDISSGRVFIRGLEKIVEHTGTKVLVTSQPVEWVVDEFGNIGTIVASLDVITPMLRFGDINDTKTNDIKRMIKDKFPKLNLRKYIGEEIEGKLQGHLIEESGEIFLWAALVMDSLEASRGQLKGLDFDTIRQTFIRGSHDLQGTYDKILEGICRRHVQNRADLDEVGFVLQMVLAAKRPLTAVEIDMAYAVHNSGSQAQSICPNPKKIRRGIHESCIPLVSHSPKTKVVTLMHKSASEYLLDGKPFRLLATIRFVRSFCPHYLDAWIVTLCLWFVRAISVFAGLKDSCFSRLSRSSSPAPQSTIRRQKHRMTANLLALDVCLRVLGWANVNLEEKRDQENDNDKPLEIIRYVAKYWQDHALAINPKHAKQRLLKLRSVPRTERHWDGLLLRAAEHGQTKVLQVLLKDMGASPSAKDELGRTALHLAAFRGHIDALQTLLEHGADLDQKDSLGAAAIHWAAGGAKPETFDRLFDLHHGRDPSKKNTRGWQIWRSRLLELRNTPDPEMPDDRGGTLLVWAVEGGSEEIVKFLLEKGAKTRVRYLRCMPRSLFNKNSLGILNLSAQELYEELFELLVLLFDGLFGGKWATRTPLARAAELGQDQIVELLLDYVADPDFEDGIGRTPIFWAAKLGHQKVADLLTRRATNYDSQLRLAVILADSAAVKNLLRFGNSDPMSVDDLGVSALACAAVFGNKRVMEALLESPKVNVDFRNMEMRVTALWIAAFRGDKDLVELLLNRNASLNMADVSGLTPLAIATWRGHEETIKSMLASEKADITFRDCKGRTALMAAASSASATTFGLMLQRDKNLNRLDYTGRSAIFHAIRAGNHAVIDLILSEPSLNIAVTDLHGSTPVSMAARFGDRTTLQKLFQKFPKEIKGQLARPDKFGTSPMKWAILNGHLSTKKLLLGKYKDLRLPPGNDAFIPVTGAARSASKGFGGVCDVCLFNSGRMERHYSCDKCFGGWYRCCDRCWTGLRPDCPKGTHRMMSHALGTSTRSTENK
ncbi:ankyrin repeat-containing domain protein [Rhypophila decipiens]|uniref:Ankyrin repeat-containing domain protein n=1 Tax=Rhypophila decipiens TaxID=261697 RepID=A0AAN6YFX4_9PEZI|nr:ankyrin repeat-containing domain protein [Rhypophila decipiens]